MGGSLYSLLNKPIQRWTGARAGEVSEAAAVKARWLGNFCPRQSVHRALKRQQQPRPLSAAPGSSALNRPGPAREFKSEARVHPVPSGPARLLKTTCSSQGLRHPPLQGTARQSGSSTPLRVGLQDPRSLTAATGSTVLNRPAPAREFKLQARVYRCHPGPGRLLKVTLSARVLRPPLQGTARLVRFIGPAPGRPAITALRCAGFYGPQRAGPARKLGSLARVHRAHSGPGPPAQVTRHGQGSTAPLQGTARPAHPVRFIDPAPGRPDCNFTPLGFIGPAPGVGPL